MPVNIENLATEEFLKLEPLIWEESFTITKYFLNDVLVSHP